MLAVLSCYIWGDLLHSTWGLIRPLSLSTCLLLWGLPLVLLTPLGNHVGEPALGVTSGTPRWRQSGGSAASVLTTASVTGTSF